MLCCITDEFVNTHDLKKSMSIIIMFLAIIILSTAP